MSIFGNIFGKKDEKAHGGCCDMRIVEEPECGCGCSCEPAPTSDGVVVKVMGTGCKKCHQLHENALEAAKRAEGAVRVDYVTDIAEIAAAGIISTPALLIDEKVVSAGKVLSVDEIEALLR